jgi:hypothetical protein
MITCHCEKRLLSRREIEAISEQNELYGIGMTWRFEGELDEIGITLEFGIPRQENGTNNIIQPGN